MFLKLEKNKLNMLSRVTEEIKDSNQTSRY